MRVVQYQQHPDGDGEHGVKRPLHPRDDERPGQRRDFNGVQGGLSVLLGPVLRVLQLKPGPGRTYPMPSCGRAARRGERIVSLFHASLLSCYYIYL